MVLTEKLNPPYLHHPPSVALPVCRCCHVVLVHLSPIPVLTFFAQVHETNNRQFVIPAIARTRFPPASAVNFYSPHSGKPRDEREGRVWQLPASFIKMVFRTLLTLALSSHCAPHIPPPFDWPCPSLPLCCNLPQVIPSRQCSPSHSLGSTIPKNPSPLSLHAPPPSPAFRAVPRMLHAPIAPTISRLQCSRCLQLSRLASKCGEYSVASSRLHSRPPAVSATSPPAYSDGLSGARRAGQAGQDGRSCCGCTTSYDGDRTAADEVRRLSGRAASRLRDGTAALYCPWFYGGEGDRTRVVRFEP
ncbi:hypothetical protein C8R44DRAFT_340538 [Mycena epipterygia]|nr:hypothetical protein C8R44DRAFT_340538 [Mycena epipterygia]